MHLRAGPGSGRARPRHGTRPGRVQPLPRPAPADSVLRATTRQRAAAPDRLGDGTRSSAVSAPTLAVPKPSGTTWTSPLAVSGAVLPGMTRRGEDVLYSVRLIVPRRGGLRAWGAVEGDFERSLAGQQDQAVTGLRIDRELRRGPDSVRVVIVAKAEASDVVEALLLTWLAVLEAMGEDLAGWDPARAEADAKPAYPLAVPVPPASATVWLAGRAGPDTRRACGALVVCGASPRPSRAGSPATRGWWTPLGYVPRRGVNGHHRVTGQRAGADYAVSNAGLLLPGVRGQGHGTFGSVAAFASLPFDGWRNAEHDWAARHETGHSAAGLSFPRIRGRVPDSPSG